MSGASKPANGRASGPVLTPLFLFVPDHSAPPTHITHYHFHPIATQPLVTLILNHPAFFFRCSEGCFSPSVIPQVRPSTCLCTVVQISQNSRRKYWATRSSVRSCTRTTHSLSLLRPARFARALRCAFSFACSLTSLIRKLMGKCKISCLNITLF